MVVAEQRRKVICRKGIEMAKVFGGVGSVLSLPTRRSGLILDPLTGSSELFLQTYRRLFLYSMRP